MKEAIKNAVYGFGDLIYGFRGVPRRIGGETIRFPARYSRYYPKGYEPDLFDFLRRHCANGQVFYDCGAHFGLFTVFASRLVGDSGRVISFEPTPSIREVLTKVVHINNCDNVEVRPEALTRKAGTATFFDTGDENSNANSLVQQNRHQGGIAVPTISVDRVNFDQKLSISCMKIDVEGAEYDLLVGAEETLANSRPTIFLSLHPDAIRLCGATLLQIWDLLHKHSFELKRIDRPVDKSWFTEQTDLFDVECIPKDIR